MQDQRADLEWRAGAVPVSRRFDDPYFSLEDGLAEAVHVFLQGNGLPDRFRDGFHIAELGFGTGLNALAALRAWEAVGQRGVLNYTSFEAFPVSAKEMARALGAFPDVSDRAGALCDAWASGAREITVGPMQITVIEGDARATLPRWEGRADAWFLDGFSPARNPELWGEPLMVEVGRHTAQGGTAATYTAAGFVRRGLEAAGFAVDRVPGFGRKRHMSVARKAET